MGQNPPSGAIIDYYLKVPPIGAVTLTIHDASGKRVVQIVSTDRPVPVKPQGLDVPTYWLKPPQLLSAQAGMHRFVWNLHYPSPAGGPQRPPIAAVPHDTPLGALGPAALPGQYTVKLTMDGHTYVQPLTVRLDPRNRTPEAGLRQHFELSEELLSDMERVHNALHAAESDRRRTQALQRLRGSLEKLYFTGEMSRIAAGNPTTQMVNAVGVLHAEVVKTLSHPGESSVNETSMPRVAGTRKGRDFAFALQPTFLW
ncbi:MAG: hypothetical protein ACREV7_18150 [Steroidobacteraceae bacterium]